MQTPNRVADLTMEEFAEAMAARRWLLLPFGTTEEHGPHLPLGTDLLWAEHVCGEVAALVGGLVAPGLPYGVCRTMRNFPGTVSLTPATLTAVTREILQEYARHGARKLACISGHAEPAQEEAVREAALPLVAADPDLAILFIGPYAFQSAIREAAGLVGTDGHAGSLETSEMLVIAGDRVRIERMPAVTRPRLSRFRVLAHPEAEYPTGVRGDTSKAARPLGERSLAHTIREIAAVLRNVETRGTEW
ncbi:MAG: creatininase family protein [Candidatus Methylomirabilales bacterium]